MADSGGVCPDNCGGKASLLGELSNGQGLVNQSPDLLDVLLVHHSHLMAAIALAVGTPIMLLEPSTDTGQAAKLAVLEDNLLHLSLRKGAPWASHYLKVNVFSGWRTNGDHWSP